MKQEPPQIDAVKRRTLPAWIREGLEKMEREKQKKLEKERMEQQRSQLSKKEKKTTEDTEGGDGPRLPQRSKFDSDEEDEDAENLEAASSGKVTRSPSPIPQEEQSEPEMTEEEKEYQMMLLTKMLLTEILLDVTDEEIYYIAKDVHRKATKGILWMFLVFFFWGHFDFGDYFGLFLLSLLDYYQIFEYSSSCMF